MSATRWGVGCARWGVGMRNSLEIRISRFVPLYGTVNTRTRTAIHPENLP
jgi:hypothetical protein